MFCVLSLAAFDPLALVLPTPGLCFHSTNTATPCQLSGDVVTEQTYNTCIKPEGEFKGKKVGPKDIIRLQTGGTGFAGHDGDKVQVNKHFSLGEWDTNEEGKGLTWGWVGLDMLQQCC